MDDFVNALGILAVAYLFMRFILPIFIPSSWVTNDDCCEDDSCCEDDTCCEEDVHLCEEKVEVVAQDQYIDGSRRPENIQPMNPLGQRPLIPDNKMDEDS